MKIRHWSFKNGSGLHHMARDISLAECGLGHDSMIIDTLNPAEWDQGVEADVHVIHSHIPDTVKSSAKKLVYVAHGTPEHCFQSSVEMGLNTSYGASDPWMMLVHYMQTSDATVTWWPRHQAILKSLSDKNTRIELVPMGIDRSIFKTTESRGKFSGSPSVLTAENCHYIKWPLDLFILWPWVIRELPEAVLHAQYLPRDQHRWFMPLIYRNGAAYKAFINGGALSHPDLINAFCSTDFYIGLVRYGDFDRLTMEAKSCGARLISYRGNDYADYWITEGDQREMARELIGILKGEVEPRETPEVHDIMDTAKAMVAIYESI